MSGPLQPNTNKPTQSAPVSPVTGWPKEIVVDHGDGTVSLFANVADAHRSQIRARRAGDVFRELQ